MKHVYKKVSSRELATIIAALRHLQHDVREHLFPSYLRGCFHEHTVLDTHEIDKLCDNLSAADVPVDLPDLDRTQPLMTLPDPDERRKSRRAYLHIQSLYGEAVLIDILDNVRIGQRVILRHGDLTALAYAAAACEHMKTPETKTAKLAIERMMVRIYDHTECELEPSYVPALEIAEACMRAITERQGKIIRDHRVLTRGHTQKD